MSETVRFVTAAANRGNGDTAANGQTAEEMHEFITFQRQLSRPTDHYRPKHLSVPPTAADNPYAPPPKPGHTTAHTYLSKFLKDPIATSLNSFSRVTNLVTSPTFYDEDYLASLPALHLLRPPGNAERVHRNSPTHEFSEQPLIDSISGVTNFNVVNKLSDVPLPPPALPLIPCTEPQCRLSPLTPQDLFDDNCPLLTVDQLLERIFRGGLSDNEFRQRLWPLVLGLTDSVDEFDWTQLSDLFEIYNTQWNAILPDQELRFTAYRERKSLIERDVIRCDRTHQFYKGTSDNLEKLKALLLTYTMYDFDTGYVQGMSDLASPLLYVMDGDVMKAFWCFVRVMKLIGTNFEMSQSSIKFQLEMLWKLIELTDPCFAQYLANKDSTNCYFAFRWIVCQFKREFMKTENDGYDDCLTLWESIWSAHIMRKLTTKSDTELIDCTTDSSTQLLSAAAAGEDTSATNTATTTSPAARVPKPLGSHEKINKSLSTGALDSNPIEVPDVKFRNGSHARSRSFRVKPDRSDGPPKTPTKKESNNDWAFKAPEKHLTDAELYSLAICLSIIRRERDIIMAQQLDATDILKHFNTLQLNSELENILLHASHIWYWLTHDSGESLLYKQSEQPVNEANDDFDLLPDSLPDVDDYFIINASNI
ncbi:TBC1 domain family member 17-like [Oppia nitens]|uniref:TBC1 domain family member 17-like n=1 Tax=Oppia nitens TaxID=1686743 RepID=UPI0023DC7B6D|nr:TBC1 domain family member 17-like [Oppia nitens]